MQEKHTSHIAPRRRLPIFTPLGASKLHLSQQIATKPNSRKPLTTRLRPPHQLAALRPGDDKARLLPVAFESLQERDEQNGHFGHRSLPPTHRRANNRVVCGRKCRSANFHHQSILGKHSPSLLFIPYTTCALAVSHTSAQPLAVPCTTALPPAAKSAPNEGPAGRPSGAYTRSTPVATGRRSYSTACPLARLTRTRPVS